MRTRGDRGRFVEKLEVLAGANRAVVVPGDDDRTALAQDREHVGWIGAVPDRVAADPEPVDRSELLQDGLESDQVRVHVAEQAHPHADATLVTRGVRPRLRPRPPPGPLAPRPG